MMRQLVLAAASTQRELWTMSRRRSGLTSRSQPLHPRLQRNWTPTSPSVLPRVMRVQAEIRTTLPKQLQQVQQLQQQAAAG